MTIEVQIDSKNFDTFLAKLENVTPQMLGDMTKELGEAVFTKSQSKGYCPVVSGTLKKSGYRHRMGRDFVIGYSASYAGYVEFGTSKMSPRAYIRRAYAFVQSRADKILTAVAYRWIRNAGGGS